MKKARACPLSRYAATFFIFVIAAKPVILSAAKDLEIESCLRIGDPSFRSG
jgi:hypothetical protein